MPYLIKEKGIKRVVLIYIDDPFGNSILDELETTLESAGGELIEKMSVPTTAQQFSGIAAKVRAAKPDAVYIASYGAQQIQIVKQLRDNGVDQQLDHLLWISGSGCAGVAGIRRHHRDGAGREL